MKVLFLCHRQHDVSIGGVAEFLHFLPLALNTLNIQSVVYTQSEQRSARLIASPPLKNGVPCYSGPFLKPSWFVSKKKLLPVLQLCELERIDVVHAQGLYRSGFIAKQIKKYLNIPYIITSHSDILNTNSDRIKRTSVQKRCQDILKQANAVTHLTPLMADASHALLNTQDKSKIIHNGIDLVSWNTHDNPSEENYLFAIGRLEPEKGFHILLEAYAKLRAKGVKTSLVIAGEGSAEKALHTQALALGLNVVTTFNHSIPSESVIFTGYIRGEIKNKLMRESKMILFATQPQQWEEPFGIVQLEAMAAGKPLISSDIAATRYLQTYGLQVQCVPADDVTAWTEQIAHLLNEKNLRKQFGTLNQKNAARFDWQIIAKEYAEVYNGVC